MKMIYRIVSVILMLCLVCASIGSVAAQNYEICADEEEEETPPPHVHDYTYWCSGKEKEIMDKKHVWSDAITGTVYRCDFNHAWYWTDGECNSCDYFELKVRSHSESHYGHTDSACEFYSITTNTCSYPSPW